jgi:hypothetical protein
MINPISAFRLERWWFSLLLLGVYSAAFASWMITPPAVLNASNSVVSVLVLVAAACACRSGYFVNAWDGVFHGVVIFDLLLEAWLIQLHEGFGFNWCAVGFTIVVGGYRALAIKRCSQGKFVREGADC